MKNLHDKPQRPTEKVLAHSLEELIQMAKTKIGRTENASDLYKVDDFIEMGLITDEVYNEYKKYFQPRLKGDFDPVNEKRSDTSAYYILRDILRMIYLSTLNDIGEIRLGIKFFRNVLSNPNDFYHQVISRIGSKINDFDQNAFLAPGYTDSLLQAASEN